jgi:hypothetical protein
VIKDAESGSKNSISGSSSSWFAALFIARKFQFRMLPRNSAYWRYMGVSIGPLHIHAPGLRTQIIQHTVNIDTLHEVPVVIVKVRDAGFAVLLSDDAGKIGRAVELAEFLDCRYDLGVYCCAVTDVDDCGQDFGAGFSQFFCEVVEGGFLDVGDGEDGAFAGEVMRRCKGHVGGNVRDTDEI